MWGGYCNPKPKYVILDRGHVMFDCSYLTGLLKLQKRAIRNIAKCNRFAHHIPLCYKFQILNLHDLYKVKALSFFHDYIHGNLPSAFSNSFALYISRNNELLIRTRYRRTNIASSSIVHSLPSLWNELDPELRQHIWKSKTVFVSRCKNFFISAYASWYCNINNCFSCSPVL